MLERAPARGLYQTAMGLALLAAGPLLLARRGRHHLETLPGRLGRGAAEEPAAAGGLWLHAVSVGEVAVAATLARALPPGPPWGEEASPPAILFPARAGPLRRDAWSVGRS